MSELKIPAWLGSGSGIGQVHTWLRWWKDGLLDCLPGWLRRKLFPSATPYILEIEGENAVLRQPDGGELRELGSISLEERVSDHLLTRVTKNSPNTLVLRAPKEWILTRRINLPTAAGDNLRQVIGFEMDRLTPFTPDQVFFDSRRVEQKPGSVEMAVDLALLPQNRIKPWLALLKARGVYPSAIDSEALWPGIDFLPPEERPRRSQAERILGLMLWLAPLFLLTLVLAIPLWQKQNLLQDLTQQVGKERKKADVVLAVQNKLEQNRKSERFVLEKRNESPPAIDVLRLTTELLPDDTWIQQFTLKQGQLDLRGMSNQATALIGLMEASPRFASVDFRSPVVQTKGQERFYLTARLIAPKQLSPPPGAEREDPVSSTDRSNPSGLPAAKLNDAKKMPVNPEAEGSITNEQAQPPARMTPESMTGIQGPAAQQSATSPSRRPVRPITPGASE